jgi:hypothetical protein
LQILRLPMLQKVNIDRGALTDGEVEELLPLVRHRQILQNLSSIQWRSTAKYMDMVLHEQVLSTIQVAYPHVTINAANCNH